MRARKCGGFLLAVLVTVGALPAVGQRASDEPRPSPNASISQTIGVTEVTISYGRPGVKGREIWGALVPYGQVWRTGANEATTISLSTGVIIEGQKLAPGTYALFTIPSANEWTLIFNKTAQQWGAFSHDASQDALRVTVKPQAADHSEWMSFQFEDLSEDSATVVLRWGKVAVPFKI
ncbi:MAG: DUF2911 domain-containing protein, partial [Terriglobia bacterium]